MEYDYGSRGRFPLEADPGRLGGVTQMAFTPDSRTLATADNDGTVRLWKMYLFTNSYSDLCADAGPVTKQVWDKYAAGEPLLKVC
jgi:WD40 repeat protein